MAVDGISFVEPHPPATASAHTRRPGTALVPLPAAGACRHGLSHWWRQLTWTVRRLLLMGSAADGQGDGPPGPAPLPSLRALGAGTVGVTRLWQVAVGHVTGQAHRDQGLPSDDAFQVREIGDGILVAVVADGASSASRAREGAAALCRLVVEHLADRVPTTVPAAEAAARLLFQAAIDHARAVLIQSGPLEQFHATMAAALVGRQGGWFAHIGDGAAVAFDAVLGRTLALSQPYNGEYTSETVFFTEADWARHLRLTAVPEQADCIVLMTDGCTSFALAPGMTQASAAFLGPVHRYLAKAPAADRMAALNELLSRDSVERISNDDKTFLWAMRSRGP